MRIATVGLWHLGSVYSACLAELGHEVLAIDPDPAVIAGYRAGRPPVSEPGLAELIEQQQAAGRLRFTDDLAELGSAGPWDIVWVTADTPVDDDDAADTAVVLGLLEDCAAHLPGGGVLAYSSQLPLGSGAVLAARIAAVNPTDAPHLVCSPENLRLGTALTAFRQPTRVVIGSDDPAAAATVAAAFAGLDADILTMSLRSAELSKHALNGFLAVSVTYANELARLADAHGADAADVHRALASDPRIGPRAYLRPGGPIAGGTLARDIVYLRGLAEAAGVGTPVIAAVLPSNDAHKGWAVGQARAHLTPAGRVAVLGLAYKAGTDTLRRSYGVEVLDALHGEGVTVLACDSRIGALDARLTRAGVELCHPSGLTPDTVAVIVVCAEDPGLGDLWQRVADCPAPPVVIDAAGTLSADARALLAGVRVIVPGRAAVSA